MGYKANITSNLLNQIIRVVLGALTSILVARTLGPSGQGYVAYVLLIFTLVGNYGHMGLNSAVMYFLKRSGTDPERLMGNNFTALLLTWLLISAVLLTLRSFGVVLGDYNYFYILGGLVLVLATLIYYNHHAWFTADERIIPANIYNMVVFIPKSLIIILLCVCGLLSPAAFFAISVAALLSNALILFFKLGQPFRLLIDFSLLKAEYSYGLVIWLSSVFTYLNLRLDQIMIRSMLGVSDLGVYSIAVSLAELMFLIPFSINSALLGRLYNTSDPQVSRRVLSQTLKFSFYICAVLALLGIPLSLLIPVFYGAAYAQAAPATMILLGGMVFASLASISPQHFFSLGKPRIHLLLSGLTLLINALLNLLWIPLWGISGAALASSISYLAFGLGYLAVFILREGFTLAELLALNRQDLKEIWNRKTN